MAIPGYQESYLHDYSDPEYYDYVVGMLGIVGGSHAEVVSKINLLKAEIEAQRAPSILTADGYVDFSKLRSPTVQELKDKDIVLVDYGDTSIEATASGFIEGKMHLFLHQAAVDYIKQITIPIPQQLQPPILYVSGYSGLNLGIGTETVGAIITHVFAATFITKWGETGPSNPIYLYGKEYEEGDQNLTEAGRWTVTLEVQEDSMPGYATSVRYYRWFNTSFRLVGEVQI